ncbi:hypothetical protein [Ruegeria sp. SCP11]|uniref:hypothetical protein n=1 Tax=Ruegeria sp. SCP11 TaxID=3141378 RepID=UPI0033366BEA
MIVGNLATYPPRRDGLIKAVRSIAAQVDRLNVVLNEYESTLPELAEHENVNQIIPVEDTKDVGKFYPDTSDAKYVLLLDDDIDFPPDYVARTVACFESFGERRVIAGYHGSTYTRPVFGKRSDRRKFKRKRLGILTSLIEYFAEIRAYKSRRADFRDVSVFYEAQANSIVVDQIATNAAILNAKDVPPYEYMADSQKFVDVRLARWAFERGITAVTLPREENWLRPLRYEETIFRGFTEKNLAHVNAEIEIFAGRVPNAGQVLK